MRCLITGVNGQLGYEVLLEVQRRGWDAVASGRTACFAPKTRHGLRGDVRYAQLDITDTAAVADVLGRVRPDVVIHCAAWTAVDAAEEQPDAAIAVNRDGTANLAAACRRYGAAMLYVSTEYVFDGADDVPYRP